jgi:hypothetical protein
MVRVWRGRGGQRDFVFACAGAVVGGPVAEEHLGRARYMVGATLDCCCGG